MYGGGEFDGNAAFAGGGFMPSQATQSADHSLAPARNRDSQGLAPLTVKQINEAHSSSSEKASFTVDGVEVYNVTVVGMVLDKAERVTDVGFVIDDGTGRLDVHKWVNEATDTREAQSIQNHTYVRVIGHLKGLQGRRELVAYSVRPVTDFNEITYHFTECMYVHSCNTKLQKVGNPTDAPGTTAMNANPYRGNQAMPPNQFAGQHAVDGLQGLEQMIQDYLLQPSCLAGEKGLKGVHQDELARQFNVPVAKIMQCMKVLEAEGLVYSTIDDFHFKSTANG